MELWIVHRVSAVTLSRAVMNASRREANDRHQIGIYVAPSERRPSHGRDVSHD